MNRQLEDLFSLVTDIRINFFLLLYRKSSFKEATIRIFQHQSFVAHS